MNHPTLAARPPRHESLTQRPKALRLSSALEPLAHITGSRSIEEWGKESNQTHSLNPPRTQGALTKGEDAEEIRDTFAAISGFSAPGSPAPRLTFGHKEALST